VLVDFLAKEVGSDGSVRPIFFTAGLVVGAMLLIGPAPASAPTSPSGDGAHELSDEEARSLFRTCAFAHTCPSAGEDDAGEAQKPPARTFPGHRARH